jgi:hypothetical protein
MMKVKRVFFHCVRCLVVGLAMFSLPALAQDQSRAEQNELPPPAFSEMLIKNALVALNQANLTGNYSVLRELGTPAFQTQNSTALLAESYATLRKSGIDMSGIVLLKPNVTDAVRRNDVLELQGFFPSEPIRISFHAVFAAYKGKMRLHGIAVSAGRSDAEPEKSGSAPSGRSDFGLASP